jgi:lactoylglutathione lyase
MSSDADAGRGPVGSVAHVALWTLDFDRLVRFYVEVLGGTAGPRYHNPRTGLTSCFVAFATGPRLELMTRPDVTGGFSGQPQVGYAHIAFALGSAEAVDAATTRLRALGVRVLSEPRTTGDGYYEAVVEDPDGNPLDLVA